MIRCYINPIHFHTKEIHFITYTKGNEMQREKRKERMKNFEKKKEKGKRRKIGKFDNIVRK